MLTTNEEGRLWQISESYDILYRHPAVLYVKLQLRVTHLFTCV